MTDLAGCQRSRVARNDLLRSCAARVAALAARSYVAGPRLPDALALCQRLWAGGLSTTVCYWNTKGAPPRMIANECLESIRALGAPRLDGHVCLKAPALGFDHGLHEELVEAARLHGVRLHFDSHSPDDAVQTFALIERCGEKYANIGCTLPGGWRRSLADADWAIERRLQVRVIKGQWDDSERPAMDPRCGFQALVERLAGRGVPVAVATHDLELARASLRHLLAAGTKCELELLYGLPLGPAVGLARELGVPVRVYVPYGKAWLPYTIAQIRKDPRLWGRLACDLLLRSGFRLRGAV
jgi:proline dehydrogenase